MYGWPIACLLTACVLAVGWYFFSLLKGHAAVFVIGFLSIPEEKRKQYDTDRLVKDVRDSFAVSALVLAVGFVLGITVHVFCSAFLFIMWLLVFFRNVNLDKEQAFEKYRMNRED